MKEKKALWRDLSQICISSALEPVCIVGDFNCIRNESGKKNCEYSIRDTKGFENFIKDNNLMDIDFNNTLFTWFGAKGKCSKLDRFLINDKWYELGYWQASSMCRYISDHKPTIISLAQVSWGPKPFRAFNWWLQKLVVSKILQQF